MRSMTPRQQQFTPTGSETVNAESALRIFVQCRLRRKKARGERGSYSITLLSADSGDEMDRSISQTPSF